MTRDVEGISKPAWATLCNNFETGWSVECSIGSRWFLWGFWVVNALFNHFFRVNLALIFVSTTCWSSMVLVSRNHTCILTLNTSIEWCLWVKLWQAFSNNWQNLEETSTNVLGPIIYRVRLTGLFVELFYFMLQVPSQAINTRDLTLLLALMKFRAWLAKFCLVNPSFLARNIKLAHACGFIHYLHSGIVDN